MRYIKTVHIENFQGYIDEIIEFEPGLNLLEGTSHSGKSAILRAISFVLHNYPRINIVRHGEQEAAVTIYFSDGTWVKRIKGEGINAYIARDISGKEITKNKIDQQIPEEILHVLGDPPVDEYNGFISYADQFSKMFLISLSPTELPKSLSYLTGVSLLEDTSASIMNSYRSLEKDIKQKQKVKEKLTNELSMLDFIDDMSKKTETIQHSIEKIVVIEEKLDQLMEFYEPLKEIRSEYPTDVIELLINKIDEVLIQISKVEQLENKLNALNSFYKVTDYVQMDLSGIENSIKIIDGLFEKIQAVKNAQSKIEELTIFWNSYLKLKKEHSKDRDNIEKLNKELALAEKEFNDYKDMLLQKGIICDQCGGILN